MGCGPGNPRQLWGDRCLLYRGKAVFVRTQTPKCVCEMVQLSKNANWSRVAHVYNCSTCKADPQGLSEFRSSLVYIERSELVNQGSATVSKQQPKTKQQKTLTLWFKVIQTKYVQMWPTSCRLQPSRLETFFACAMEIGRRFASAAA